MDILYIGGTGQISWPCVLRSVDEGHKVTLLNRGATDLPLPEGVETITGDMNSADPYANLGDRNFDVVAQFRAFLPEQVAHDIKTFAGRTGQYVFISSASVYEKPARHYIITEKTPAINPFWPYSQRKIECENLILESEGLDWTIIRPSHTVRTGLPAFLGEGDRLGHRLLAGKPVIVSGDGMTPWTLTRSEDFAVPFVNLFGKQQALGEIFHITQDRGYTWNQINTAIGVALGVTADIVHVPTDTLVKYKPEWAGPLFGDKAWTALFDNSKVKAVAGDFTCETDLSKVLSESIAHFRKRAETAPYEPNELDALFDRICAEQRALGE